MTDTNDIRSLLPILQSLGISPDTLGPDKMDKLLSIADEIKNPENITIETTRKIMDMLNMKLRGKNAPVKNKLKIGRNEMCPCDSGKKYKKCHGFLD